MTKTYCDVCGKEMTEGVFATDPKAIRGMEDLTEVSDVCERCHIYGGRINPRMVLLDYWKRIIGVPVEKEDTDG